MYLKLCLLLLILVTLCCKQNPNMLTVRAETLEGVAVVPLLDVEALGPVEARIGVARVLLVAVGSFVLGAAGALVVLLNKGAKTKTQVSPISVIFFFFFFLIRSHCLR